MTFSLAAQIEEVERELALRREVYPRMVARRQMRQAVADYHLARMQAVRDTLLALEARRTPPRAAAMSGQPNFWIDLPALHAAAAACSTEEIGAFMRVLMHWHLTGTFPTGESAKVMALFNTKHLFLRFTDPGDGA